MSLKFTALAVKNGDAFLLEDNDNKEYGNKKTYLFDSGGNQKDIKKLLDKHGVNKLDVAICSHNDADHSHGFIGLLKLKKFIIKEIWLPELWCTIINYAVANKDNERLWSDIEELLSDYYDDENDENWEDKDLNSLFSREFKPADEIKNINNISQSPLGRFLITNSKNSVVQKLNNIIKIVSLALKKGCTIVWFKNIKKTKHYYNLIYGFVPLNSKPTFTTPPGVSQPRKKIPCFNSIISFVKANTLTAVNHFSLVFEFYLNRRPIIRFSADSNCSHQTYQYSNIIITAPHHGSDTNGKVLTSIKGSDIIWVRTYNNRVPYPYKTFIRIHSVKYCVRCVNCVPPSIFDEVSFDYNNNKWNNKAGTLCKCIPTTNNKIPVNKKKSKQKNHN